MSKLNFSIILRKLHATADIAVLNNQKVHGMFSWFSNPNDSLEYDS